MDASASINNFDITYRFNINQGKSFNPSNANHKNSVTKYTRLPDFDLDGKVSWQKGYVSQPRFRRIVSIEEPANKTSRSLKSVVTVAHKKMTSNISRKIVTIEENNENDNGDVNRKFPNNLGKTHAKGQSVNRSVETKLSDDKHLTQRTTTRSTSRTLSGETKSTAKSNILNIKNNVSATKLNNKNQYSKLENQISDLKKRNLKEDNVRLNQNKSHSPKISIRRKKTSQSQGAKEIYKINNKLSHDITKENQQAKNIFDVHQKIETPLKSDKGNISSLKNVKEKRKPISVIVVPKEKKSPINVLDKDPGECRVAAVHRPNKLNRSTEVEKNVIYKDINVGTEPHYNLVDRETEMSDEFLKRNSHENNLTYDRANEIFDSLDIPNVSLTKDKNDLPKEEIVNFLSKSLPNIRVPALNMISLKKTQNEQIKESLFCNNNSYIISRATVTYTSKQKIDFQVVGNHENNMQKHLRPSPLNYPVSVVSVYKKELAKREYDNCTSYKEKQNENDAYNVFEQRKDVTSLNCSLVFDSDKLKKPSDIISTIKVDNSLLQNSSSCEQFQRELNFIDSFFESLQYLETCSLSDKSFTENNVENWINSSYNFDCASFLSKFENEMCVDENETMASTSLSRLNLLIRHEQKRAKNLLFVLKMREDALKDFTRSQILWLENKKKQENTDISTLKKKQRGALLKLQHECGEMQRIRKALLTRSEKRKTVLMKTKKNLEWKLENNLDVEKIILGKKKMNRGVSSDRSIAPVKCFDLSSSGCDESTTSRPRSNTSVILECEAPNKVVVEKSIQAGDSKLEVIHRDQSFDIANEHFVVVDGGYLNIIFKDLSLPQIFSGEKQYEVNEEAIKNILSSSKSQKPILDKDQPHRAVGEIIDQIKSHEHDNSSSPSTARSLVEELDQYYKGLLDDHTHSDNSERNYNELEYDTTNVRKSENSMKSDLSKSVNPIEDDQNVNQMFSSQSSATEVPSMFDTPMVEETETQVSGYVAISQEEPRVGISVSGPLPVPAGAAAVSEPTITPTWEQEKPTSPVFGESSSSSPGVVTSVSSTATNEAEELRRQQLAIEREIKALEQQQCQFLVVREIPDKPPPPYTPPIETRPPKPPRSFAIDITTKERIKKYITEPDNNTDTDLDAFKLFVKDFCQDSLERQKAKQVDKVWESYHVLQPKPQVNTEKLVNETAMDLKEVLTCVTPTVLSGVDARRSDHIDDILFAEWRRCEPEWTSLHNDEIIVKNQLFEDVFEKILGETLDEYKRLVLTD